MSKDYRERVGALWLMRDKESPRGTASTTGGVSMYLESGSWMGVKRGIDDDAGEVRGVEGPSELYRWGDTAEGKLVQKRARPDFCIFSLAYFFGACSSSLVSGTAYEHEITPLVSGEHPAFTLAQRSGNSLMKERYTMNFVEGFTLKLDDKWVSFEADIAGSGKRDVNYTSETVTDAENATQLTLASNGVEGSTAADRLENVPLVRVRKVGEQNWTIVNVTAVSAATPAVLTIDAPGASGSNVDYEVYYYPTAASWETVPSAISESPMKLTEARVILDSYFDGSQLVGGTDIDVDLTSLEIKGQNGFKLKHVPDGSGSLYAAEAARTERAITISLSRRLTDIVRQRHADLGTNLAVALKVEGAEIDPGGQKYGLTVIFPKVGITDMPVKATDKFLVEAGELVVMHDDTYGFGKIYGYNKITSYL